MKRLKGIIFDFNGVLLLDQDLHDNIWKGIALGIRGKALSEEEIKNVFHGRTNRAALEYLFDKTLDRKDVEQWVTKKETAYQELARSIGPQYQLAPGAVSLLDELKLQNIPFTIATSSPEMNIGFFNRMLGLDKWFDVLKIAHDDGSIRSKPAPDLYLRAAEFLALAPGDCVVIEDARSGIASAHAAGIGHIIAIGPKDRHDVLRKIEGVDEVIESLDQIDVQKLFG